MYISHAYVGLVNDQYFKGNPWEDALVKGLFYTSQNAEGNLSTVNQLLKLVILLHTKSEEKLPHDNISHFLLLEAAHCYNLSYTPAMNFEPRSLLFMKNWYKMLQDVFSTIYERSENEGTERSLEQPGVHRPQSSNTDCVVPNRTPILEFKSGTDLIIEITPGTIETAMSTRGWKQLCLFSVWGWEQRRT